MPIPSILTASADLPVSIYYCKAGIPTGQTVRVSQGSAITVCRGVRLDTVTGDMLHGNSVVKAKASGARCVLHLSTGRITIIP